MTSSNRGYITSKEQIEQLANITVTDEDEMWDQVNAAEQLVDQWVGHQEKAYSGQVVGAVTAVDGRTIYDTSGTTHLFVTSNAYAGCTLEIVGGTGVGQTRRIVSSSRDDRSVTLAEAFTTEPDTTSVFRIHQLAKFPRKKDVFVTPGGNIVYKVVPEAISLAVAYQVAFIVEMGDKYFAGDGSSMDSESIGNYSYSRGFGASAPSALVRLMAPRARAVLSGIKNRTGELLLEDED